MRHSKFRFFIAVVAILALLTMMTAPALAAPQSNCTFSTDTSTASGVFTAINQLPAPWPTIVYVTGSVVILGLIVLVIILRRKPIVQRFLLNAVCEAEQAFGSKTGYLKFNQVYQAVCNKYPLFTFFLPEATLYAWIEAALKRMKEFLETAGANLLSASDEAALKNITPTLEAAEVPLSNMGGATDGNAAPDANKLEATSAVDTAAPSA